MGGNSGFKGKACQVKKHTEHAWSAEQVPFKDRQSTPAGPEQACCNGTSVPVFFRPWKRGKLTLFNFHSRANFTAASRTRPWLASGSGCRGRHPSTHRRKNSGAPGEIRTPDLLLRRTRRTNNQRLVRSARKCDPLPRMPHSTRLYAV